ncbi:PBS lyase HEAT-like repeat protein [Beggiatoa sp. PS]|nr:PBS lyase HEAT-like repeat protein [Beggiatoa sp. PS]
MSNRITFDHEVIGDSVYSSEHSNTYQSRKKATAWLSGVFLLCSSHSFANTNAYHFHLNVNHAQFEPVEVHHAQEDGSEPPHYLYETVYQATDIEPDKLFTHLPITNIEQINTELIERLPVVQRIEAYWQNGEMDKALSLARFSISENNIPLSIQILNRLATFRTLHSFQLLEDLLQQEQNVDLKLKIVEALSRTQAPLNHALPVWIAALTDKNNLIRRRVAKELGKLGHEAAVEPLLTLFQAHSSKLHASAAQALGQLGNQQAIEPLIALLNAPNSSIRENAVKALGKLRSDHAIEPLIGSLKDTSSSVHREAAYVLGLLKSETAIEPLIAWLKRSDLVHNRAAYALEHLGDQIVDPLIAQLNEPKPLVRLRAAQILGHLNHERAIKPLIALLNDPNPAVRRYVSEALGQLGHDKALQPLITLLKDADGSVRNSAVVGLGLLSHKKAIEPLLQLLNDPSPLVRQSVAKTLSQLGGNKSAQPLMTLLKDPEWSVRQQTAVALGELSHQSAIPLEPLIALLQSPDWFVRQRAAEVLGNLGPRTQIESVIKLLNDPNWAVRMTATDVLGKLGRVEAVQPLIALLQDANASVLEHATTAIGQLGDQKAVAPLINLLQHSIPSVRRHAAEALGQLGDEKAVIPLIALLNDKTVSASAAIALGNLGYQVATSPLLTLLNEPMPCVQVKVSEALKALGNGEGFLYTSIELLSESDKIADEAQQFALQAKQIKDFALKVNQVKAFALKEQLGSQPICQQIEGQEPELLYPASNVQLLVRQLEEDNFYLQMQTIESLGQIGRIHADKVVSALLSLVGHNDSLTLRQAVIKTLGKILASDGPPLSTDVMEKLSNTLITSLPLFLQPLTESNEQVKIAAIETLGQIGWVQAEPVILALLPLLATKNINIRKTVVQALGKIAGFESTLLSKELRENLLDTLANIAKNQQEVLAIRVAALNALGKMGSEAAAKVVIDVITQEIGPNKDSYRFAAFKALAYTHSEVALAFLKQQLTQLEGEKQAWREQRDEKKTWHYSHWETELGYAIAQIDPEASGIQLLSHHLANVRQGAWFGIAKVASVVLIQSLSQQRTQSDKAYFRHAAYQAIDNSLIYLELFGNSTDLQALATWLPRIADNAVRKRVEWTIAQLQ